MRISDWSSDVCSSDLCSLGERKRRETAFIRGLEFETADFRKIKPLARRRHAVGPGKRIGDRGAHVGRSHLRQHRSINIFHHRMDDRLWMNKHIDRKSVVWGKSVSVRVDIGGRRNIKKKKQKKD